MNANTESIKSVSGKRMRREIKRVLCEALLEKLKHTAIKWEVNETINLIKEIEDIERKEIEECMTEICMTEE